MVGLQKGDILLYAGKGFAARVIQMKTWSRISHCEIYVGDNTSFASRDGIGVGAYPLRTEGLAAVMRPREPLDLVAGSLWFQTVNGQKYDWLGLLAFASAKFQGRDNNRMFCSEFLARFIRRCGLNIFNGYDADGIAPGEFLKSDLLERVW